jgi:hypothetical protein
MEAAAAIDLVPRHYLGKSLKAMIAAARGNRPAAEVGVRSFQADAERNHWAALRVALIYAKLGDRDKAIEWLRRAAAGTPGCSLCRPIPSFWRSWGRSRLTSMM